MNGTELARDFHDAFDRLLKPVVSKAWKKGYFITCDKKCFACCSEIVIVARQEAEMIAELVLAMPEDEQTRIKEEIRHWIDTFSASEVSKRERPKAEEYRKMKLPCPLLKGGLCTVYEDRPVACRGHLALGERELCDDDAKRENQSFILVEQLVSASLRTILEKEDVIMDHLGVWLAEILLGIDKPSDARTLVRVMDRA